MGGSSLACVSKSGHRTSSSTSSTVKNSVPSSTVLKRPSVDSTLVQRLTREDYRLLPAQEKLFSDWKRTIHKSDASPCEVHTCCVTMAFTYNRVLMMLVESCGPFGELLNVLVGPTDWHNHAAGVEGAEKYRLHNLPSHLGPGIYELGLCHIESPSHCTRSSSHPRKKDVIIVYIGQAENIRTRLQHYGRCGSHLEGGADIAHSSICRETEKADSDAINKAFDSSYAMTEREDKYGGSLFTKAFSQGFSVAFRWAQLESKSNAEAVEMGLLKIFDYAWNRGNNGRRRPYAEIGTLQKHMEMSSVLRAHICTTADKWSRPLKWRITHPIVDMTRTIGFKGKKLVITVLQDKFRKLRKNYRRTSNVDKEAKLYNELQFLPWKFPSLPDQISQKNKICGMTVTEGVICTLAPRKGRKRCELHRGMRISGSRPSNAIVKKHTMIHAHAARTGSGEELLQTVGDVELSLHCGYLTENGSRCMVMPEKGRKRCTSHKGRRVKCSRA